MHKSINFPHLPSPPFFLLIMNSLTTTWDCGFDRKMHVGSLLSYWKMSVEEAEMSCKWQLAASQAYWGTYRRVEMMCKRIKWWLWNDKALECESVTAGHIIQFWSSIGDKEVTQTFLQPYHTLIGLNWHANSESMQSNSFRAKNTLGIFML